MENMYLNKDFLYGDKSYPCVFYGMNIKDNYIIKSSDIYKYRINASNKKELYSFILLNRDNINLYKLGLYHTLVKLESIYIINYPEIIINTNETQLMTYNLITKLYDVYDRVDIDKIVEMARSKFKILSKIENKVTDIIKNLSHIKSVKYLFLSEETILKRINNEKTLKKCNKSRLEYYKYLLVNYLEDYKIFKQFINYYLIMKEQINFLRKPKYYTININDNVNDTLLLNTYEILNSYVSSETYIKFLHELFKDIKPLDRDIFVKRNMSTNVLYGNKYNSTSFNLNPRNNIFGDVEYLIHVKKGVKVIPMFMFSKLVNECEIIIDMTNITCTKDKKNKYICIASTKNIV